MEQAVERRFGVRERLRMASREVQHRIEGIRYDLGTWNGPYPTPHAIKRRIIRSYARRYGTRCMIETGTFLGDMLAAMAGTFDELYSIELSEALFQRARQRFAGQRHIHLIQGNSNSALGKVLDRCGGRALIWLDAHYSGGVTARGSVDSPVLEELATIGRHLDRGHVVLIDDARMFVGENGYPSIPELAPFVEAHLPGYEMEVAQDVIRLTPAA